MCKKGKRTWQTAFKRDEKVKNLQYLITREVKESVRDNKVIDQYMMCLA
jgi:hypothetical protein